MHNSTIDDPSTAAAGATGRGPGQRTRRWLAVAGVLVTIAVCVLVTRSQDASADAGFGVGLANVTTNGFTHPWLGGYLTDVGTAWCIESGRAYPRAAGHTPAGDLPAARGVSPADRRALAYSVWAYTATTDPTWGAGLAAVVHGLSGDDYASRDVASMSISSSPAKAVAVFIADEARRRAHWVSDPDVDPWRISIELDHLDGVNWKATTTVTTAEGEPIADHRVGLVPYNVTEGPATEHVHTTDATGTIVTRWTQADPAVPVTIDAQTTAPTMYRVWKGPEYLAGSVPQRVITSTGTIYRGRGQAGLPTGEIRVVKTTDNPAYQTATGAVFDVIEPGDSASVGTLTVGADGRSDPLEVPVGDYVVTEGSAPAGVAVDPTPYPVRVTADTVAELRLTDPVQRLAALDLIKVDVATGEPLAGAELLVERDDDGDGTYETTLGTVTSALEPVSMEGLAAGDYRITEVEPPPGYELPEFTVQLVSVGWDQTAAVTFADHRSVAVTTLTHAVDPTGELPAAPEGLGDAAHAVASIGHGIADAVTVTGLAPGEEATVSVALYGPAAPDAPTSCTAAEEVFRDSWTTSGSGTTTSSEFTPRVAGRYTWVATVEVPGFGSVTGPCGEVGETAVITPTVDTEARASGAAPGGEATDRITLTGLAEGTEAAVITALYGPFASTDALVAACTADDLGDPVGAVRDTVVAGPARATVLESGVIALPEGDDAAGLYTFISTLAIAGFPPISHDCGAPAETFRLDPPPTTTTTTTVPPTSTTAPTTTTAPSTTNAPTTTAAPTTTTAPTTTAVPSTVPPSTTTTVGPTTTSTILPSREPPPTAPATSPSTTTIVAMSTTTTTTAPTTTVPPTTASTTTVPGSLPAPPAPDAPAPARTGGRGSTGTAELPRTGARLRRNAGIGGALILTGGAALLLVARHRLGHRP